MAQFDVHLNLGRSRRDVPLLLVVQTEHLSYVPTRLVMPLAVPRLEQLREGRLIVRVAESFYAMVPYDMFAAPRRVLGEVVASLRDLDTRIIRAIDDVITTAYG